MRRKMAILAWGIVVLLAGCGQAVPAGNLARNITMGTDTSQPDAGKDANGREGAGQKSEEGQESGASAERGQQEEGVFGFLQEGVTLVPGEAFDQSVLGECVSVSEVPSCAFDGTDRVYDYGTFELTANVDGKEEHIYSIYFIDPNLPTTEGLCMGDTLEDVRSLYGEDCETAGSAYVYTRGNTVLSIITQNDVVVGIEYRWNR